MDIAIFLELLGNYVVGVVLLIANTLLEDHTPGLVSAGLVGFLIVAFLWFSSKVLFRCQSLRKLRKVIEPLDDEKLFENDVEIKRVLRSFDRKFYKSRTAVRRAWGEYRETFTKSTEGDQTFFSNSVRPSYFFNPEDLRFGAGFWRYLPGLFVMIGLFLTFLGLISALRAMNAEEGVSEVAMSNLLAVASAKFIMSLTGLLCSIVFTVVLRLGTGLTERAIHHLNHVIEKRLTFLSLEDLASKQLKATNEQRDHFREIGMELIAEFGRPLYEELPKAISKSIGDVVSPLMSRVGEVGTESMQDMVRDLSKKVNENIGDAIGSAGQQLTVAGDRLGSLVDRMNTSSSQMGSEMSAAGERFSQAIDDLRTMLTDGANATNNAFKEGTDSILGAMQSTLDGIRNNTEQGARAMSDAASEMRTGSEQIKQLMGEAAEQGAIAAREHIEKTGNEVATALGDATAEVTSNVGDALLKPIQELGKQLNDLIGEIERSSQAMERASSGVKEGATAAYEASGSFRSASGSLVKATEQVQPSVQRIETATQNLAQSTRVVGETAQKNTESVHHVLQSAQEALGGQRQAIANTLAGLQKFLDDFKGQGDRLDDIDEKLGRAFEEYRANVDVAIDRLANHVREMHSDLDPALQTMRSVVEQAVEFVPQQSRGHR